MRVPFVAFVLASSLSSCARSIPTPDGGVRGVIIAGKTVMGGLAFVPGDYSWSVAEPPRLGRETLRIVKTDQDTWLLGTGVSRWVGEKVVEVVAPQAVTHGWSHQHGGLVYVDQAAVVSATDVTVCGSARMHWDGTAWDVTGPTDGGLGNFGCSIAANGGQVLRTLETGRGVERRTPANAWTLEVDLGAAFIDATTGTPTTGSSTGCLEVGPAGEVLFLGKGIITAADAGAYGETRYTVTPALRNAPGCRALARVGASTWYGVGGINAQQVDEALPLTRATFPGDFQALAWLKFSELEAAGLTLEYLKNASRNPEWLAAAVAGSPDGALYAFRARDRNGNLVTFFVELKGTTARMLPDRLYGWELTSLAVDGSQVLVSAQGGALLKGVKR